MQLVQAHQDRQVDPVHGPLTLPAAAALADPPITHVAQPPRPAGCLGELYYTPSTVSPANPPASENYIIHHPLAVSPATRPLPAIGRLPSVRLRFRSPLPLSTTSKNHSLRPLLCYLSQMTPTYTPASHNVPPQRLAREASKSGLYIYLYPHTWLHEKGLV